MEHGEMTAVRGLQAWNAPAVTVFGGAVELTANGTGFTSNENVTLGGGLQKCDGYNTRGNPAFDCPRT